MRTRARPGKGPALPAGLSLQEPEDPGLGDFPRGCRRLFQLGNRTAPGPPTPVCTFPSCSQPIGTSRSGATRSGLVSCPAGPAQAFTCSQVLACASFCLGSHLRRTLPGRAPWAPPCWQNNNFIDSDRRSHRQTGAEPGWRSSASSPTPAAVGRAPPKPRPQP